MFMKPAPPGTRDGTTTKPTGIASRVFDNPLVTLAWVCFLILVLMFISFPIQRVLLVLWVYGMEGYHQGIRVIPRKPLRFSDGTLVPQELDILTGAGMFFLTTVGLTLALFGVLRVYEISFGDPQVRNRR
jgi:hypothetical protein